VNPERTSRWGDSRLDDEFAQIREELHDLRPLPERVNTLTNELRAMRDLPKGMAEIAVEFRGLRRDVGNCFEAIRDAEEKRACSRGGAAPGTQDRSPLDVRRNDLRSHARNSRPRADRAARMTAIPKGWRILICSALVMAAASAALAAFLFSGLRDVSLQGCHRQNSLRHELNLTLRSFHQRPRFQKVDCKRAYSLHAPF
jgi:hypothetical protein